MSDVVSNLRDQSVADCVAYMEFMLKFNKNSDTLYCFYEGYEDRFYYPQKIEILSSAEKYADYICGGKDEVIKVNSLVKNHEVYKRAKTGFFVDMDFDQNNYDDTVYVTPVYSIENFFCTQEALEKILRAEFRFDNDRDCNLCIEIYNDLLSQFFEQTEVLNSWLACQADYRNNQKINTRLKIDKKLKPYFRAIVAPDLKSIAVPENLKNKSGLESIFEDSPIIEEDILDQKISQFRNLDPFNFFRGKFILAFLTNYLLRLQSIFGTNQSPFEKKYSCNLRFEYPTICSTLSQYARHEACLKEYITRVSA